jgi:GNAT superfamily N-acetyltransferase
MSIRTIRWPDDEDAILDYIRQVYGPADYDNLVSSYGSMPAFDPADCFVIDGDQGEIAAHAMIVSRHLQLGVSVLPTAEISLLGVRDTYQGRGYERMLLEAIHERMAARGDALGLSFGSPTPFEPWQYEYAVGLYLTSYESEIATDLALRAGQWDPARSYERRTADRLGARSQPVTIRRCYLDDLPAVQALYAAEGARGHYLIARDLDIWTWQMDHLTRIGRNDPDDFLVAEADERLVAYARIVSQGPVNAFRDSDAATFSVIEAGGDHADGIEALLGEAARLAQTLNAERIGLFVHPESAFMRHALARGGCARDFTGAGFARLHDLSLAMDLLAPTLNARHQNSPFAARSFRLSVMTEDEQTEVALGPTPDAEFIDLEVPSSVLLRLITGWYGVDHVETGYREQHADLLRALFPPRDPKIGLADLI